MVSVEYDRVFKKHFKLRIAPNKNLVQRYLDRLDLFLKDRNNLLLKDHKLSGRLRESRSFSITGNIRVIYRELSENHFEFLDIGTHAQVYGM